MNVSNNFDIKELVHPLYIEQHGEAKMIRVLKRSAPAMLEGLEELRQFIGGSSIVINDYKWGGHFIDSGVRHAEQPLENASLLSAHYFMAATDCKIKNRGIKDLQLAIMDNQSLHTNIVRMEDVSATPTWLHIQWGRRRPNEEIIVFKP